MMRRRLRTQSPLTLDDRLFISGANPKQVTHDGVNLFHWAVFGRCIETCRWSIAAGADPQGLNRWGCSAIHWAASTGDVELCSWLRDEVGLDFKQRNNQGHDGLMKAAWNGAAELCGVLLEWDPDTIVGRDRAGMGPPEMARVNGHPELAAVLDCHEQKHRGGAVPGAPGASSSSAAPSNPALGNKAFVVFYRNQGLVSPERWDALHDSLLRPLPVTVRARSCGSCAQGQDANILEEGLATLLAETFPELKPLQLHPATGNAAAGSACAHGGANSGSSVFQVCNKVWKRSRTLQEVTHTHTALLPSAACHGDVFWVVLSTL